MFDSDARSAGEAEPQPDNAPIEPASAGMHTRYRDKAMSWLALGALLAAWHMPVRVDRPSEESNQSRAGAARGGQRQEQLWITRATEARTWIARAPHGVVRAISASAAQPDWPSIASVRTARRWLKTL